MGTTNQSEKRLGLGPGWWWDDFTGYSDAVFTYLFGYLGRHCGPIYQKTDWQIPLLAMFFLTLVGTILVQFFSLGILQFLGTRLEWMESINLVILPSTLLNLILALPVYLLMSDLANWVYPSETEE